jgi:hypothetical protein
LTQKTVCSAMKFLAIGKENYLTGSCQSSVVSRQPAN